MDKTRACCPQARASEVEPAPLPLTPREDWPEPSGEEVAANMPRYYPLGETRC